MQKSWKTGMLSILACCSLAMGQHARTNAREKGRAFQWDGATSHELGPDDMLKNQTALSSGDRQALTAVILDQLQPRPGERDAPSQQELRAQAAETRIKFVDLNNDGVPEVIAQGSGLEMCSPTGNCEFWVFRRVANTYKVILRRAAVQSFEVRRSRSGGFNDLVLEMHGSATEQELFVYRYREGRYRRTGCFDASWTRLVNDEIQELKEPDVVPCGRR